MTMQQAEANVKPTYGYYRQPNGWITVSPATELEELKYRREGWTPLTRYGRVEMATEWAADHPLESLFIQGGARELSVDQVLQCGLHLHPPLIPTCGRTLGQGHIRHSVACWEGAQSVVFPQIEGRTDLGPFPCRFCGDEKPTVKARDQHESVAHKDERSDVRTGESLANALVKGLHPNGVGFEPAEVSTVPASLPPGVPQAFLDMMDSMRMEIAELKAANASKPKTGNRRKTKYQT